MWWWIVGAVYVVGVIGMAALLALGYAYDIENNGVEYKSSSEAGAAIICLLALVWFLSLPFLLVYAPIIKAKLKMEKAAKEAQGK